MIDREILATRLSKLREALRRLRPIAAKLHDDYMASEIERALAEHYLRLSLEAMLDASNHLIAAAGFRKPLQVRDIPLILGENGVIAHDLANKLARAVGLRNRLVHGYPDIDHEILYSVLQNDLVDLEEFAIAVARHYGE
ncbi:MAG TPA: DUF86 domain-containing protein [Candidatus Competibacteraceae bacterium]|nr:DUF86 domain-containing protein [Candidatus Competibacteraceae bacterium]